MCGEKLKFGTNVTKNPGSPPRVRGKEAPGRLCSDGRGITPAYAGKSFPTGCNSSLAQDHPRVCGEKTLYSGIRLVVLGSPPRVRGKGEQTARPHYHMRITPACAGKRRLSAKTASRSRDHPRVCGEKLVQFVHFRCPKGSPPRVRGKEDTAGSLDAVRGITPACAGKSGAPVGRLAVVRDHPRVCGEKRVATSATGTGTGSPPRVRGKGSSMVQ